jgi:hydroxyethylthiazole kinase-like uncharacterized protein yjeF
MRTTTSNLTGTTGPLPVLQSSRAWPMFYAQTTRLIEQTALACTEPHALMAQAGLSVARLAQAIAPRGRHVWVVCGPGNNGGDGLMAAMHLQRQGWRVRVSLQDEQAPRPDDAADALNQARALGLHIEPSTLAMAPAGTAPDLVIDALLGLGASRAPTGWVAGAIAQINALRAPVLAVDLPTGLCGDTGKLLGDEAVIASHTLSLLTLKPGLFTASGRDHAGQVWLDDLGRRAGSQGPDVVLNGSQRLLLDWPARQHQQHKGSFGDVLVVGGASGMGGAAQLAARAALTAGAGRVYLARLDGCVTPDLLRPELMPRAIAGAMQPEHLAHSTLVCGCGGGAAVAPWLTSALQYAQRLVLDADALNALAKDDMLKAQLRARSSRGQPTVLTPHPLEAARLLDCDVKAVQDQRLAQAQALAEQFGCTVVLKGSGSVIASPGQKPVINPTGNSRLGSGGTGDVLAGWLGGLWSQGQPSQDFDAACASVWLHGAAAEHGNANLPLRANDLIEAMAYTMPSIE